MARTKSLVHINNNLMVSLDLETTGLRPGYHEIIQIACIPLDNWLEPSQHHKLFEMKIKPDYPDRVDQEALEVSKDHLQSCMDTGIDSTKASELFEYWFNSLKLGEGKKIVPLGSNITQFDMRFLESWLGPKSVQTYFTGPPRDVMIAACFLNDVSDFNAEQTPFNKLKLKYIAHRLDIEVVDGATHDALYDALLAAKCYKKMLTHHLLEFSLGVPM